MEINNKNKSIAMSDYLSCLQLKYDCETIYSLSQCIIRDGVITLGAIPYFTLAANAIQELLIKDQKNQIPYSKKMEDIRVKLKFFEDGYSRSRRMILNIDYLSDEAFKNMITSPLVRALNIHDNIGIYTNNDKVIIGNTQYFYYLLQDNRFLKSSYDEVAAAFLTSPEKFNLNDQVKIECFEYGRSCGEVIGSARDILRTVGSPISINVNYHTDDLYYADYNTKNISSITSSNNDEKAVTLFLLHLLSTINFLLYILNGYEKDDYGWWLKINYIVYYYSIEKLKSLRNHYDNNPPFPSGLLELLDDLRAEAAPNCDSNFRNFLMHSKFLDKNDNFIISASFFDITKPLFGFVETCFDGKSYNEIKTFVIAEMYRISDIIAKWFDTQSLNIKLLK